MGASGDRSLMRGLWELSDGRLWSERPLVGGGLWWEPAFGRPLVGGSGRRDLVEVLLEVSVGGVFCESAC